MRAWIDIILQKLQLHDQAILNELTGWWVIILATLLKKNLFKNSSKMLFQVQVKMKIIPEPSQQYFVVDGKQCLLVKSLHCLNLVYVQFKERKVPEMVHTQGINDQKAWLLLFAKKYIGDMWVIRKWSSHCSPRRTNFINVGRT